MKTSWPGPTCPLRFSAGELHLKFFRAGFVNLLVGGFRHLLEPLSIGGSADHISDLVIDPIECGKRITTCEAKSGPRLVSLGAIHGETLARGAFIHIKRSSPGRTGKQPAANQLQPDRLKIGNA